MATGDILSFTVRPDGWSADVVVEGFTTGATYAFGLGTNNANVGAAKVVVTVVSEGYNSAGTLGTVTRTLFGTIVVRLTYPTETAQSGPGTTRDETTPGGNLSVRIALSDAVYDDDNTGAGKSGTAPTVSIAAGWCVNTAGAGQSSNAITGLTVVNNSTLDYPQVVCQWDEIAGACTADRVRADFYLAANARHRHGIAAVKFTATGQTSSHSEVTTSIAMIGFERVATSLWGNCHRVSVPIAGFTQGESVSCDFVAYPVVGDSASILDSSGFTTDTDEVLGCNRAVLLCDKDSALDDIVYVSTTGNNTTGDGSIGNPYATIAKAVTQGNIVYLSAGTHSFGSTETRKTANEWTSVRPAPGESSASVTVQLTTTTTYRCKRLEIRGVKVTLTGSTSYASGETAGNFIRWNLCVFDSAGVAKPTTSPGYSSYSARFHNCTGDLGNSGWAMTSFGVARVAFNFDGCEFGSDGTINSWYRMVACKTTVAGVALSDKPSANTAPAWDNVIFESNQLNRVGSAGGAGVSLGDVLANTRGVSVCGNVIEKSTSTSPAFEYCVSSVVGSSHIIIWHNTITGERCNWNYNNIGSSLVLHRHWSQRFNAIRNWNTKTDTFAPGDAARVGGWQLYYGVGSAGNRLEISNFEQAFGGIDYLVTGDDAIEYVDNASYTGDASGSGDYTPGATSVLRNRVPAGSAGFAVDLFGTIWGNSGDGSAGAIQRTADLSTFRVSGFFFWI